MTLTAASHSYRQNFGPFAPEIYHSPFPYEYRGWTTERALDSLTELFETRLPPNRVAALIIEPQLGEGGFVPAPFDFLRELRRLTKQHGIVLILDEIQSGFGRTGKMFGFQHAGIEPDLVALAKSLAGGMPLSAVVGKAEIMDAPLAGALGGTYGGAPLACAAALAVLDVFREERLLERAESQGQQLHKGLGKLAERFPQIGDMRGLGPMLGLEFVRDRKSKEPDAKVALRLLERARAHGLLLLRSGPMKNVIRILAPLVTTEDEVARALTILEKALEEAVEGIEKSCQ
jgi:4-aminobutyrate aminotransferase/(S)-3-amino-2-methylpropionate transaminase